MIVPELPLIIVDVFPGVSNVTILAGLPVLMFEVALKPQSLKSTPALFFAVMNVSGNPPVVATPVLSGLSWFCLLFGLLGSLLEPPPPKPLTLPSPPFPP